MPAKHLIRIDEEDSYSHVYNRGVEKRVIFSDEQDYEVFQGFLKDYLTTPQHPESTKKTFTVNGRSYQGIPHQPKNYFNQVELVAYSLMPDHFHLILNQKTRGSLEGFIRSLCTRYSMYFNRKYNRTGSLFGGPYKSVQVKEASQLASLTHYIHHGSNDHSSYPEYSGKRKSSWVITNVVPSVKEVDRPKEEKLLQGITFEDDEDQLLERRDLEASSERYKAPTSRIPEMSALFAVFLVLTSLGLRNINVSQAKSIADSTSNNPVVLSESVQPTSSPEPTTKTMVVVQIPEDVAFINVRMEPSVDSDKIGEAKNEEAFEFVSVDSGWYKVKLADNSEGYISAEHTYLVEMGN